MSSDVATIVYSYFFVTAAVLAGVGIIAKHSIQKHTEELKDKLNRIEYALYNDGHTGLINKVDQLIENQNLIKIDVEVMKARAES
jgi:ABC-type amino acid transport substrate-binding protein